MSWDLSLSHKYTPGERERGHRGCNYYQDIFIFWLIFFIGIKSNAVKQTNSRESIIKILWRIIDDAVITYSIAHNIIQ